MKKLLTILVLIMLIISFFQITSMYALYKEKLASEYSTLLGLWAIKVNGTDITTSGQVEQFTISSENQLQYIPSEYIQAGKIAPGGQAYFDIVIDPTDTDVSIVYTIDVDTIAAGIYDTDKTAEAKIELVDAENYFKLDGEETQTANETEFHDENLYTSVIPMNMITQGYKNYIRLYFEWVNDENRNTTDSALAASGTIIETEEEGEMVEKLESATISIPIEINLKQYTGEVIGNVS